MAEQVKRKPGRPSRYTPKIARKICELIAEGFSERQIAQMEGMPTMRTIIAWKDVHPDFLHLSVKARELSAQIYDDRRRETADWLVEQAKLRAASMTDFPKGVVEALKAAMGEDARSAALRDDSRYGDRKKVTLDATVETGQGMAAFYAGLLEELCDLKEKAEDA